MRKAKGKQDTGKMEIALKVNGKSVTIEGIEVPCLAPGMPHVAAVNPAYCWHPRTFDILMDVLENKWVLLAGHAGTGKSSVFEQLSAQINQPCKRESLNGGLTVGDLIGFWTVKGGETIWIDGVLPQAMRNGWWLVLDEIDCAPPEMMSALNDVLAPVKPHDPVRRLSLKEKGGEVVEAHPNFRIMATANTVGAMEEFRYLYPGAKQMNYALLTRARIYVVDYLPEDKEIEVLLKRFPRFNSAPEIKQFAKRIVDAANLVREAFKNRETTEPLSLRQLEDWAEMLFRHIDRRKKSKGISSLKDVEEIVMTSADAVILSRINSQSRDVVSGILTRTVMSKDSI